MTMTVSTRPTMPDAKDIDHHFMKISDGRIHVASQGAGEPILLLPGFAQTWWQWRNLMPSLAAGGFRAIALDLRGEGWSDLPSGAITRTRRAEDVVALLDALGLERVRLVSHDIGAITAYQLSLGFPERISAQVVLAVPPPQMKFFWGLAPGMRHLWHQEVLSIPGVGPALLRAGRLPRRLFSNFSAQPMDPEAIALGVALLRNPDLSRSAGLLCRRMVLPELGRIIGGVYRERRFAMRSLFIFGNEDIAFPPHVTRKVFTAPSVFGGKVELALIEGAGHYVIDEAPDATIPVITQFLAQA